MVRLAQNFDRLLPRFLSSRLPQIHWCHHQNRHHGPGHRCCEDVAGLEEKLCVFVRRASHSVLVVC